MLDRHCVLLIKRVIQVLDRIEHAMEVALHMSRRWAAADQTRYSVPHTHMYGGCCSCLEELCDLQIQ